MSATPAQHCPRCGKQGFASPQEAYRLASELMSRSGRRRKGAGAKKRRKHRAKVYWAVACATYHVTSDTHADGLIKMEAGMRRGKMKGGG